MKPMEFWEMEDAFIFTGIVILLVAAAIGFLAAVIYACLVAAGDADRENERQATVKQASQTDPCGECLRWPECNGVDEDCPLKMSTDVGIGTYEKNDRGLHHGPG